MTKRKSKPRSRPAAVGDFVPGVKVNKPAPRKCHVCGKPITVFNDYGMYCEDLCGMSDTELYVENIWQSLKKAGVVVDE